MTKRDDRPESARYFEAEALAVPFSVLPPEPSVLIIGAAGGREVLASLHFGAAEVTGVELNPVTYRLMTDRFAEYSGGIMANPRVTLLNGEGRAFVERAERDFDLIYGENARDEVRPRCGSSDRRRREWLRSGPDPTPTAARGAHTARSDGQHQQRQPREREHRNGRGRARRVTDAKGIVAAGTADVHVPVRVEGNVPRSAQAVAQAIARRFDTRDLALVRALPEPDGTPTALGALLATTLASRGARPRALRPTPTAHRARVP